MRTFTSTFGGRTAGEFAEGIFEYANRQRNPIPRTNVGAEMQLRICVLSRHLLSLLIGGVLAFAFVSFPVPFKCCLYSQSKISICLPAEYWAVTSDKNPVSIATTRKIQANPI